MGVDSRSNGVVGRLVPEGSFYMSAKRIRYIRINLTDSLGEYRAAHTHQGADISSFLVFFSVFISFRSC